MNPEFFSPFDELARQLLPAMELENDGAHDLSHIARVWRNATAIYAGEGGDLEIIAAAVLLHDCVHVPKNSPDRARASQLAAAKATAVLYKCGWPTDRTARVTHAVEAHSYSAGITPSTIEARIVQDADRLDAIGAVGIARCFYTAGRMGSELYNAADTIGTNRALDDTSFALDHFPKKLFQLTEGFKTSTGQRLAQHRHKFLKRFYEEFLAEVSAEPI